MAKIFISHYSEDKDIVDLFKNIILNAGLGISDNDIAYTSAPETGVPTGGNIPQYIKENIANSDFVFFMISDNYRKSEVCLNEMGAAWALDKNIKPILLYDIPFNSVGWLYNKNLCAKIDDSERLDTLRDEMINLGSIARTSVWNRNKKDFLSKINNGRLIYNKKVDNYIYCKKQTIKEPDNLSNKNEHLGVLDYIKLFSSNQKKCVRIIKIIHASMESLILDFQIVAIDKKTFNRLLSDQARLQTCTDNYVQAMNNISDIIEPNYKQLQEKINVIIDMGQKLKYKRQISKNLGMISIDIALQIDQCRFPIFEILNTVKKSPNISQIQIAAKKRLINNCNSLIKSLEDWKTEFNKLSKNDLCLH